MVLTKKALFSVFSLIFGSFSLYLGPLLWYQGDTYYRSHLLMDELGYEQASPTMHQMVQQALKDMEVPCWQLIQIKKTTDTSCSSIWHIWMNETETFGPAEYVAYHEAAHIACGHGEYRLYNDITSPQEHAQEIEADLLAAETLYRVGKKEIIYERIAHLQFAVDQNWQQPDLDGHPSLEQMVVYFTRFLESKGHADINKQIKKYFPALKKLHGIR